MTCQGGTYTVWSMPPTPAEAVAALAELFAAKYDQAIANGATDEQAVRACRLLWLDTTGAR